MSFVEAVRTVLSKYATFSGRARRSEYWFWTLAIGIAYVVAVILAVVAKPLGFIFVLLYLGVLIPSLAVGVRRLHDTDKSGWLLLLGLIPLVGSIVLLVFYVSDSTPGENRYGPNPKQLGGWQNMPPAAGYGQAAPL